MLAANHIDQGACYTNISTRKWIVMNVLGTCYRVFSETSLIKRLDEISSTFKSSDPDRIVKFSQLIWSLDPAILDAVRICICFENFFKAELLLKGYVIHRIDKGSLPAIYRYLAKDQSMRPIKISEIKLAEGLRWKRKNNYSFQSLSNFTIELSVFLRQQNYKSRLRMPTQLITSLERINRRRNTLHYLTNDISFYNQQIIDEVSCIKRCFNDFLVTRRNQLVRELNYPDIHLKQPLS